MKKMIITCGWAALILFGVTYGYAQGPGIGPGHRAMHFQESLGSGKAFQLTPEQKNQFRELRRKFQQENAQLIGALVTKRLELRSLWADPKADSKVILDKEKEFSDLQGQMRSKMVEYKLEARKFLSPEQMAHWKPGWGMGRGRMMGRGSKMGPGHMMDRGHMMGPGSMMGCGEERGPRGGRGMWQ
jgi:Spy/CpxP family protein refolding chaperone